MNQLSTQILMERKSLCFRSFLKISSIFLAEIENNNIENLDEFQKRRTTLIQIIQKIDNEILANETSTRKNALITVERQTLHQEIQSSIQAILNTDLKITQHLERIKTQTLNKITQISNSRKTIGAYRSPLEQLENQENKQNSGTKA